MFGIGSLVLVLLLPASGGSAEETGEDSVFTASEPAVFRFIRELTGEDRPWTKPIEKVDMEMMRRLLEAGLLTFHEADWFCELAEDNE